MLWIFLLVKVSCDFYIYYSSSTLILNFLMKYVLFKSNVINRLNSRFLWFFFSVHSKLLWSVGTIITVNRMSIELNRVAACRGMHVSPAKHSYAWLPRKCDYRTDTRTDRRQTKWSLCAAMLCRRHKKFISHLEIQFFLNNQSYLPSSSLQLGQVQATLRSRLPGVTSPDDWLGLTVIVCCPFDVCTTCHDLPLGSAGSVAIWSVAAPVWSTK